MIGRHLLVDFYSVPAIALMDVNLLLACLQSAAERCGLTPVASPMLHPFDGGGITGFLLLAESHIALHTYPEYGFVALDIFSCGETDPQLALEVFRSAFNPQQERVTIALRGSEMSLIQPV